MVYKKDTREDWEKAFSKLEKLPAKKKALAKKKAEKAEKDKKK